MKKKHTKSKVIGFIMGSLLPYMLIIGGYMLSDYLLYGDALCAFKHCVNVKEEERKSRSIRKNTNTYSSGSKS